jgi:hypothetical protein
LIVRPQHHKTFPRARIAETLLMFLRLRGGEHSALDPALVYAPLADYYELSDQDRTLCATLYYVAMTKPGPAWHSEVKSAGKDLKDDGYLVAETRSGNSVWRLTPSGVDRADFWLKRMIEKTAALKSLKLGADRNRLTSLDQTRAPDRADA